MIDAVPHRSHALPIRYGWSTPSFFPAPETRYLKPTLLQVPLVPVLFVGLRLELFLFVLVSAG